MYVYYEKHFNFRLYKIYIILGSDDTWSFLTELLAENGRASVVGVSILWLFLLMNKLFYNKLQRQLIVVRMRELLSVSLLPLVCVVFLASCGIAFAIFSIMVKNLTNFCEPPLWK